MTGRAGGVATLGAVLALGSASVRADGPTRTMLDRQGTMVAAYGGWAAWSRLDPATNAYALVVRSPAGAISLAPVPEREAPFDVELGPNGRGVTAVYSRCSDRSAERGCRIYELTLGAAGASELPLATPGSSVHEPAIWDGVLVYLQRNPAGGAGRPDSLLQWRVGSAQARSVALAISPGVGLKGAARGRRT